MKDFLDDLFLLFSRGFCFVFLFVSLIAFCCVRRDSSCRHAVKVVLALSSLQDLSNCLLDLVFCLSFSNCCNSCGDMAHHWFDQSFCPFLEIPGMLTLLVNVVLQLFLGLFPVPPSTATHPQSNHVPFPCYSNRVVNPHESTASRANKEQKPQLPQGSL